MNVGLASVAFVVALAVALLPGAEGRAHAASLEIAVHGPTFECCDASEPCKNRPANDCGSLAGCNLNNCPNLYGALPVGAAVGAPGAVAVVFAGTAGHFPSNSNNPPAPPPRV